MSQLNGDKARFQKNRRRKLQNRQQSRELVARLAAERAEDTSRARTRAGSLAIQEEGGPTLADD
jgi:uncharacterized protein YbaP (TraB family)